MSFLIRRFGADIVKPDYLQALRGIVLIEDLGKPHFPVSQHKALPVMEHVLAGFLTDRIQKGLRRILKQAGCKQSLPVLKGFPVNTDRVSALLRKALVIPLQDLFSYLLCETLRRLVGSLPGTVCGFCPEALNPLPHPFHTFRVISQIL